MKFDQKLEKLENLVVALENNDTDLEDSIDKYNEAMNLIKEMEVQLNSIEEKVNKILTENGTLEDLKEVE